jgi:hypothetical protein
VLSETERNPKLTLSEFLAFLDRLEEYDTDIPLATFEPTMSIYILVKFRGYGIDARFRFR